MAKKSFPLSKVYGLLERACRAGHDCGKGWREHHDTIVAHHDGNSSRRSWVA